MKLLLLVLGLGLASAFQVSKVTPGQVKVKQGGRFQVICTTDNWWEVRSAFSFLFYFLSLFFIF